MKQKLLIILTALCGFVSAQTNYVLEFDGTSDYVNLGSTVGSNIRSIEFQFNPSVDIDSSISTSGQTLIWRNDGSEYNEYGIYIRGTDWLSDRGNLYFAMRDNGILYEIKSDSNSWAAGTWYHVCGTIDATNGMKLYINGVLQAETDSLGTKEIPSSSEITTLGIWGDAYIRPFDGQMDELRVWNRSLDQSEIQSKMCTWLTPANETGLVGYWKMDEGSGATIFDAVGANNGSISGATFVQENGCFNTANYALEFNSPSDYVNLGSTVGNNIRSIEFQFNPNANITPSISTSGQTLIWRNDGSEYNEYGIYIRGTDWLSDRGNLYFAMRDNGILYEIKSDSNSWSAGTWYHVCGTIDATNGMKLYINGVLQAETDPLGTREIPSSSEITTLGIWGDAYIRPFEGQMDELRFWDRSLNQNEIQSKMCTWLTPANETGLVGYWNMNEGSGTTIFDAVGANDGSISGATFVQESGCFTGYLSVNETARSINITNYPNPFSSQTILQSEVLLENATLMIFNSVGQQVKQIEKISGHSITFNRDNLASGFYTFLLMENSQPLSTGKLVITDY